MSNLPSHAGARARACRIAAAVDGNSLFAAIATHKWTNIWVEIKVMRMTSENGANTKEKMMAST